jgi:hypothetical protein
MRLFFRPISKNNSINNQSAKGKRVSFRGQANGNQVAAVCQPIRPSDYEISAPCFYQVLTGKIAGRIRWTILVPSKQNYASG